MRPISLLRGWVNHRLPSDPATMSVASTPAGIGNSVIATPVVMRPIWFVVSVNQRLPSGPTVIELGPSTLVTVGGAYSVKTPAVVTRPILLPNDSVNHRFPSGPTTIPTGTLLVVGGRNQLVGNADVVMT